MPTNNAKGLEEVLGLLEKATPGEWRFNDLGLVLVGHPSGIEPMIAEVSGTVGDATREAANARAITAAVNYLRSHGAAIAELVRVTRAQRRYVLTEGSEEELEELDDALRQVEGP